MLQRSNNELNNVVGEGVVLNYITFVSGFERLEIGIKE